MTPPPPADESPADPAAWAPPDAHPAPGAPVEPATPPETTTPGMARTSRLAIAALVTGLLGLVPFAVGLAVAALVRTGRKGQKGRGLAIAGLAASTVWAVALTAAVVTGAAGLPGSGAREDGKVAVAALRPGECFGEFTETATGMFVKRLPCTVPHQGEVSAEGRLTDIPVGMVRDRSLRICGELTEFLQKSPHWPDLTLYAEPPGKDAWADGERAVKCVLRHSDPKALTAPLDRTVQGRTQWTSQLAPGECIKEWDEVQSKQPLVECTEEHEYEVLARYTMQGKDYPGDKEMERRVTDGCAERAAKVWGADPPFDLVEPVYVGPDEEGWNAGERQILCLVTGKNGPLKRSVVPR